MVVKYTGLIQHWIHAMLDIYFRKYMETNFENILLTILNIESSKIRDLYIYFDSKHLKEDNYFLFSSMLEFPNINIHKFTNGSYNTILLSETLTHLYLNMFFNLYKRTVSKMKSGVIVKIGVIIKIRKNTKKNKSNNQFKKLIYNDIFILFNGILHHCIDELHKAPCSLFNKSQRTLNGRIFIPTYNYVRIIREIVKDFNGYKFNRAYMRNDVKILDKYCYRYNIFILVYCLLSKNITFNKDSIKLIRDCNYY